jgi:hypothetical protein
MVDQAFVNGRGSARVTGSGSTEYEGVAEFVDDLASLASISTEGGLAPEIIPVCSETPCFLGFPRFTC